MMQINNLVDITSIKENTTLECKLAQGRDGKGALPHDFWETYSAFANTEGGTVLLGIQEKPKDQFVLAGIPKPQKVIDALWAGLNNPQKVSQNILKDKWVEVITIDGVQFIQIHIPRAPRKYQPVYIIIILLLELTNVLVVAILGLMNRRFGVCLQSKWK